MDVGGYLISYNRNGKIALDVGIGPAGFAVVLFGQSQGNDPLRHTIIAGGELPVILSGHLGRIDRSAQRKCLFACIVRRNRVGRKRNTAVCKRYAVVRCKHHTVMFVFADGAILKFKCECFLAGGCIAALNNGLIYRK